MRVLYIHQYFRKPVDGGAIRSYYLAKSLVDKGVYVDLITTHNHNKLRIENVDGINVHFLPIGYDNKFGFFKRVLSFVKFMRRSYKYATQLERPNYVYATSTPLTVGITAWLLKKFKKIPYYFEVRDLWPEAPIQMGVIKNPLLKRILYWLEKKIYLNSEKIIALSPGMKEGVLNTCPELSVEVISNISDCDFFQLEEKSNKNNFYYGTTDKFVVSYIGAIGEVNQLDSLLDVALECELQGIKDIAFFVAGRGKHLKIIKEKASKMGLRNIRFLGFLNRNDVKKLLNVTDCSFISFADKAILETNSPNKFFDSIAAGKLCVVNNEGWIKDIIEENEIGFYFNPNIPMEFVEKITPYLENKTLLNGAKRKARTLAEKEFSRKKLSKKYISLFNLTDRKNTEGGDQKIVARA